MSIEEIWKPVLGYEDRYLVSSLGRVFSLFTDHPRSGRILQPVQKKRGYLTVTLHGTGKRQTAQIHALVCEAFHGPCPPGKECRHRNGISSDNREENLHWGTHQENADDAKKHGAIVRGEKHPACRLTNAQVLEIRALAREGQISLKEIGARYGIGKSYAWKLSSGYRRNDAGGVRVTSRYTTNIPACR